MTLDEFLGIDITNPSERSAVEMEEWRRSIMETLVGIRKYHGMSPADVAEQLMITRQAVAKIEKGHRDPRLSTLIRYAIAVGAHIKMAAEPVEVVYPNQAKSAPSFNMNPASVGGGSSQLDSIIARALTEDTAGSYVSNVSYSSDIGAKDLYRV